MKSIIKIAGFSLVLLGSTQLFGMELDKDEPQKIENSTEKVESLYSLCRKCILKQPNMLGQIAKNGSLSFDMFLPLLEEHLLKKEQSFQEKSSFPVKNEISALCAIETEEGPRIISGSFNGKISIFNLKGTQIATFQEPSSITSLTAISTPEGIRIISGSGNIVSVFDLTGTKIATLTQHTDLVSSVHAVSTPEEGLSVISGSIDGMVLFWNPKTDFVRKYQSPIHNSSITSVYAEKTNDGLIYFVGYDGGIVRIFKGNSTKEYQSRSSEVISICGINTKNNYIMILGYSDGMIQQINLKTQKILASDCKYDKKILSLCTAQSQDGWKIIVGYNDLTLHIFDLITGKFITCNTQKKNIKGPLSACTLKEGENYIIISGCDKKIDVLKQLNITNYEQALAILKQNTSSLRKKLIKFVQNIVSKKP